MYCCGVSPEVVSIVPGTYGRRYRRVQRDTDRRTVKKVVKFHIGGYRI